jgi:hypothetical protein
MSACGAISAFLDGRLEADEAARFEAHLEGCADCRRAIEAWRDISARMVEVSNADCAAEDPSTREQLGLVQRAELEHRGPRSGIVRLALAATALLALGVAGGYWLAGSTSTDPTRRSPGASADEGSVYRTDPRSRTSVRLADDTIHLGPGSEVRVLESGPGIRLALDRGSLACDVAERPDRQGFSVEAAGFSVRVTGTRFLVALGSGEDPARVVVSAGKVEVLSAVGARSLGSGQGLEIDARAAVVPASDVEIAALDRLFDAPSPARQIADEPTAGRSDGGAAPEPVASIQEGTGAPVRDPDRDQGPGLDRWRAWVIEGRLDEARSALREHLATRPADAEAWSLLADCERKRTSWEDAVSAYDKLISLTDGERANRARYKAAQILQDRIGDQRRAADLLERFVEAGTGGSLLVDKARLRLARALLALGLPDRARAELAQVIASASDGETVATARQMLEQLERE